jgi:nicotinamide-nucleotide amidase
MADTTALDSDTLIVTLVARLAGQLEARGWRLATAESCTGGLVAGACTERAGSSVWFERGIVSYSNAAKTSLLGVPAELIVAEGAVSEAVARAMALGAQAGKADASAVEVAVSITGVAGPTGGSAAKPVGTVCFGWALPGRCWTERCWFDGERAAVRRQSVVHVLGRLVDALEVLDPSGRAGRRDTTHIGASSAQPTDGSSASSSAVSRPGDGNPGTAT